MVAPPLARFHAFLIPCDFSPLSPAIGSLSLVGADEKEILPYDPESSASEGIKMVYVVVGYFHDADGGYVVRLSPRVHKDLLRYRRVWMAVLFWKHCCLPPAL